MSQLAAYEASPPAVAERLCELVAGHVVCELGCADGWLTDLLRKSASHVYGLEIDAELAKVAVRRVSMAGNVTIALGDFTVPGSEVTLCGPAFDWTAPDLFYLYLSSEAMAQLESRLGGRMAISLDYAFPTRTYGQIELVTDWYWRDGLKASRSRSLYVYG